MFTIAERRLKSRAACDYQAIVQGIDLQGNLIEENARLDNLSVGGLFMWINRCIEIGSKVSVIVLFRNMTIDKKIPKLATEGIVVRTEPQMDGRWGVAVKFSRYRFI